MDDPAPMSLAMHLSMIWWTRRRLRGMNGRRVHLRVRDRAHTNYRPRRASTSTAFSRATTWVRYGSAYSTRHTARYRGRSFIVACQLEHARTLASKHAPSTRRDHLVRPGCTNNYTITKVLPNICSACSAASRRVVWHQCQLEAKFCCCDPVHLFNYSFIRIRHAHE